MNGIGLQSMQERARMIYGQLTITTAPSEGTAIYLTVPLGRSKMKVAG
jgi:signal transduction histidine kinase